MRPKLKNDTFYIPVSEGVYFRNNQRAFVMRGKTVAAWMERLAPYLDGRYELDRLCHGIPEDKRAMVSTLVTTLTEQGYIKDVSGDQPHSLTGELLATYAPFISLLDHQLDSPEHRYEEFLALPVLAVGSGDALAALAHALLETGSRQIHLLDLDLPEEPTDHARIAELLAALQADRDPALALHTLTLDEWRDKRQLQAALAPFRMVIFLSASSRPQLVNVFATACERADVSFLPAVALGDQMVIGPTHQPNTAGCWQCYWRRRRAALGLPDDLPVAEASHPVGAPALAIAANLLAFEFFKQGTGLLAQTLSERVFALDLASLTSAMHSVFPHPLCAICAAPLTSVESDLTLQRLAAREAAAALRLRDTRLDPSEFHQQTTLWADAHAGIFTRIDERDYFQLPLIRSQITLAGADEAGRLSVLGAGLDYQEAREAAVRRAVTLYLERLPDPRLFLRRSYQQVVAEGAIAPQRLFGWSGQPFDEQAPIPWLWATRIADDSLALAPAALIYTHSSANDDNGRPLFQPETPGIGVGATWSEALVEGLIALAAQTGAPPERLTPLALGAYADDPICAAYLNMLAILEAPTTLFDATGSLGIPRIASYRDGNLVHLAAHWDALAAARNALQATVHAIQIERFPSPQDNAADHALATPLTAAWSAQPTSDASPLAALPPSLAEIPDHEGAVAALLARLLDAGWDVYAAPLTRDPTVATVLGCALRVMAARRD